MSWLKQTLGVSAGCGVVTCVAARSAGFSRVASCSAGFSLWAAACGVIVARSRRIPCESSSVDQVYSETYVEARDKFREAALAAGAEYEELQVVEDLATGVAVLAGDPKHILVHVSGTHGVEGHAGSAIQVAALRNIASQGKRASGQPTVIFVHLLNPFGFKYGRRWNENNVDLNRNNLDDEGWAEARRRAQGETARAGYNAMKDRSDYETLSPFLNPSRPAGGMLDEAQMWATAIRFIAQMGGTAPIKKVVAQGQFHNPQGIFYGGDSRQRSLANLSELLSRPRWRGAQRVALVDVHTGLGDKPGEDILIVESEEAHAVLRSVFGASHGVGQLEHPGNLAGGAGGGAYRDVLPGHVGHCAGRIFPDAETLELTQEFGTVANELVLRALRGENAHFHHGPAGPAREAAAAQSRAAFFVRTRAWKESVVSRGLTVFERACGWAESVSEKPQRAESVLSVCDPPSGLLSVSERQQSAESAASFCCPPTPSGLMSAESATSLCSPPSGLMSVFSEPELRAF